MSSTLTGEPQFFNQTPRGYMGLTTMPPTRDVTPKAAPLSATTKETHKHSKSIAAPVVEDRRQPDQRQPRRNAPDRMRHPQPSSPINVRTLATSSRPTQREQGRKATAKQHHLCLQIGLPLNKPQQQPPETTVHPPCWHAPPSTWIGAKGADCRVLRLRGCVVRARA
jgi:hypothetical protein